MVLFHILNNISYRYFCAHGIFLYIYILRTGNEKLEQFSLILMPQMKSLFIENRIKKKKKNQFHNGIVKMSTFTMTFNS